MTLLKEGRQRPISHPNPTRTNAQTMKHKTNKEARADLGKHLWLNQCVGNDER